LCLFILNNLADMQEKWVDVVGFETLYQVSNLGKIRSVDRSYIKNGNRGSTYLHHLKGKPIKPKLTKFGYYGVGLVDGCGGRKHLRVNRLVALAFIPNPDNLPEVHHKDHNKINNCVDNLEWVTKSKNIREAILAGKHHGGFKRALKHHIGKLSYEDVSSITELIKVMSNAEIADRYKISRGHVSTIVHGKRRVLNTI